MFFNEKNEMPNQITEVVMLMAPNKTKIGESPKYTSDKIPNGIKSPPKANQEILTD